jgi:hypothetical protein
MTSVAGKHMTQGGVTVMNGSEPAFVPAFTPENPIVDLTGTIPPQPLGRHAITVYALWTDFEDENPMSTHFLGHFSVGNQTIQQPNQTIELINQPFIITLGLASTVSATIIGLGVLVYFKKRKR